MAHLEKNTKLACPNLVRHFERNEGIEEYKNKNIDATRTHLNYNLAPVRENQLEFIKKRCSEVKCLKRDDVKVMANWLVTLPKDVKPNEEELFFKETYNFLKERYGDHKEENIISAYVHKDETTPHMHFAFIPITLDKEKNILKVSSKELITRYDIKTFHSDLDKHIATALGRQVSVLNGITRDGNLSIDELQKGEKAQEYVNLTKDIETSKEELKALKDVVEDKNSTIEDLQKEINELKKQKEVDQSIIKAYYDMPTGKKTLGGSIKLKKEEYDNLVEKNKAYLNEHKENVDLKASRKFYNDKINSLEYRNGENKQDLKELRQDLKELKKENKDLTTALSKKDEKIKVLYGVANKIKIKENLTEQGQKAIIKIIHNAKNEINNIDIKPTLNQPKNNIKIE